MNLKKCVKCEEMADEAQAFCPGCGNSFVDEQLRTEDSEFDVSGGTMQFSRSAFNLLLSDMGLNTSQSPEQVITAETWTDVPDHRAESVKVATKKSSGPSKSMLIIAAVAAVLVLGGFITIGAILMVVYRNYF